MFALLIPTLQVCSDPSAASSSPTPFRYYFILIPAAPCAHISITAPDCPWTAKASTPHARTSATRAQGLPHTASTATAPAPPLINVLLRIRSSHAANKIHSTRLKPVECHLTLSSHRLPPHSPSVRSGPIPPFGLGVSDSPTHGWTRTGVRLASE
jgi:hypothetical protein